MYRIFIFLIIFVWGQVFFCGIYDIYRILLVPPHLEYSGKDIATGSVGNFTVGIISCPPSGFNSNFGFGSKGSDIYSLQTILNNDPATLVAATGPGSPGNETVYFGALTEQAVDNFQMKYADAILFPSGLQAPTGYVGPATRSMLNAICQ